MVFGDLLADSLASMGFQPMYGNSLGGQQQQPQQQQYQQSQQQTIQQLGFPYSGSLSSLQGNTLDYLTKTSASVVAGGGGGNGYGEPVQAAIATKRTYEVRPVQIQSDQSPVPSVVDIQPSEQPVHVLFRTQSSPVLVQQVHTPAQPPEVEKTHSEDPAHRVVHNVYRYSCEVFTNDVTHNDNYFSIYRPIIQEERI